MLTVALNVVFMLRENFKQSDQVVHCLGLHNISVLAHVNRELNVIAFRYDSVQMICGPVGFKPGTSEQQADALAPRSILTI